MKMTNSIVALPSTIEYILTADCKFRCKDSALAAAEKITKNEIKTWEHKVLLAKCFHGCCRDRGERFIKSFVSSGSKASLMIVCNI